MNRRSHSINMVKNESPPYPSANLHSIIMLAKLFSSCQSANSHSIKGIPVVSE